MLSGATFTDANPGNHASDFTATIAWGDSTSATSGTVSYRAGVYSVSGSHLYAKYGTYSLKITVKDVGGKTATITGSAVVGDAPLTGSTTAVAAGTEGLTNSSVLSKATFTDANPGNHMALFTATINWGDGGATSAGTISYSTATGAYTVAGSHTYADEGSYPISISVADGGGSTATITGTATVADATLTGSKAATATGGVAGTAAAVLSAATFTDANPGNHTSDFTATIAWGDSTPTTSGTVTYSGGVYTVAGSHVYSKSGTYSIKITVKDVGGKTATITGTAVVGAAPAVTLASPFLSGGPNSVATDLALQDLNNQGLDDGLLGSLVNSRKR